MEMGSTNYRDALPKYVKDGVVSRAVLDEAVRRVLTVKFEKGLFERPFTDETRYQTASVLPDAVALARSAAAKSCVLLKNESNTLPLSKTIRKNRAHWSTGPRSNRTAGNLEFTSPPWRSGHTRGRHPLQIGGIVSTHSASWMSLDDIRQGATQFGRDCSYGAPNGRR